MELMRRLQSSAREEGADHDKDARTLVSLVRTYEKLNDIKEAHFRSEGRGEGKDDKTKGQSAPLSKKDADQQRRDIAARLEKLIKGL